MKFSVIIPTYNRRDVLAKTMPPVLAQDFPPSEYEVIIVVDGSTDGTVEFLRGLRPACALKVVEQPNRGQAAAKNAGLERARGDLILFLDDDILCPRSLLKEHALAHPDGRRIVAFGPIGVAAESRDSLATELTRSHSRRYYDSMIVGDAPLSTNGLHILPNSSVPRDVLVECGGFDPRFYRAHEDRELAWRLCERGVGSRYLPSAICQQIFVKSPSDILWGDTKCIGRAEIMLCRKHPGCRLGSELAIVTHGSAATRIIRRAAIKAPFVESILSAAVLGAERMRHVAAARRAGTALLFHARRIALLRIALREVGSWPSFEQEFAMKCAILAYHHVGPARPGTLPSLSVAPEKFERQIRWLAACGFTGIRPSDWLRWCRDGKPLPRKPILITFDDGYRDTAEFAFPILHRYRFGAGVFVVTGLLDRTNVWEEAKSTGAHRLMSARDIRYWSGKGIEFGAHSRTHADLTTLRGGDLEAEIAGSADDLGCILGVRPASFAYPYGIYDSAVLERVRKAFQLALTCDAGLNGLDTNLHLLRRTVMWPSDTPLDVLLKAELGWSPLERLRWHLRLRTRLAGAFSHLAGVRAG